MTERKAYSVRAQELISKMTLAEKIGMVHGAHLFQTAGVPRLGIPSLTMSDGPMGVRQNFEPDHWMTPAHQADQVTYLPCNSALASTWNRQLAREMGSVLGEEARGRGKDVILAPGINIKRSPLCGRDFEYFSEDPYLTGELAADFIEGVQEWDVAACVKHFAVNNQETMRLEVEVDVEEETLRTIYLRAFHKAIEKGHPYSIMGAYNLLYGEHCCQSDFLLKKILRDEWEYDGTVISDWGAVHDTEKAALSQLDIEMSVTDNFDEYFMADPLKKAIESGKIRESVLDEKVEHILILMMRLHMLDGEMRKSGSYNTPEHRQVALDVARESIILLKNEHERLPLQKEKLKKILLIGENADRIHSNGGGSAEIKSLYEVTPLLGCKAHAGGDIQIDYTAGYTSEKTDESRHSENTNWQQDSLQNGGGMVKTLQEADQILQDKRVQLRKEAVQKASENYDAVIFVGGLNHDHDAEGNDRSDMKLPYEQDELIKELLEIRSDMIVVMYAGSPVDMTLWADQAQAILWSYYAGMEGGNALADVLFGNVNPSGKLAETLYENKDGCSAHVLGEFPGDDKVHYTEGKLIGYRYNDTAKIAPLYCFGHGLSYTTFSYSDPVIREENGVRKISCTIQNTGSLGGSETIQVYARESAGLVYQELVGFEKIYLQAGAKQAVEISLEEENEVPHTRRGKIEYMIGSSSGDDRLTISCQTISV